MKIVFLTKQKEKEIAESFKKKVKIVKKLDPSIKLFCQERYKNYFDLLKREIKEVKIKSKKLKKLKKFILELDRIFVSTNIFRGPNTPEGSAFKDGIILKYNLFYKDFKFAMIHEATHFLFHMKQKIDKSRMEIEANVASFILMQIPKPLWIYMKLPYSFSIWKEDIKELSKLKFKVRIITPEEYLWLKYGVLKWDKNTYKLKIKLAERLISKIKLVESKEYSLPFVFWPGNKIVIKDCIYLPKKFIGKDLKVLGKEFYGRIKKTRKRTVLYRDPQQ
jgi:hypothetical protein